MSQVARIAGAYMVSPPKISGQLGGILASEHAITRIFRQHSLIWDLRVLPSRCDHLYLTVRLNNLYFSPHGKFEE